MLAAMYVGVVLTSVVECAGSSPIEFETREPTAVSGIIITYVALWCEPGWGAWGCGERDMLYG